jgi:lysophospholipase L1-like esterase
MRKNIFLIPSIIFACIGTAMWSASDIQAADKTAPNFELKDGDRVVFLGNTLIERAQQHGFIEATLTVAHPDKNIIFRNLGWSGDDVWARSHAVFDFNNIAKGYTRLMDHIKVLKPTVIILGYGGNEAFAGKAGLDAFVKQYNKLLDDLTKASDPAVRFVFLSPLKHEDKGPPLPDPTETNKKIKIYHQAIYEIAAKRGGVFVDLYRVLTENASKALTNNGLHLNERGYLLTAVTVGLHSKAVQDQMNQGNTRSVKVSLGSSDRFEQLRQIIIAKNQLYFQRWRPQNITYLLLFRKREQGNNAVEIPQYDPLIAKYEKQIAELRKAPKAGEK